MLRRISIAVLLVLVLGWAAWAVTPARAQDEEPPDEQTAAPPQGLALFTRYPSQEWSIDDDISIKLTLRADRPQVVQLETQNVPDGWQASFRGDNRTVRSAYVTPDDETTVDLKLDPPDDVTAGTYELTVVARGEGQTADLPLEVTLADTAPQPGGMTFDVELPTLRGGPDTTFRYSAKLENDSDQELTVNLQADAPRGLQVDFKLSGQSVTSVPLGPDESKTVNVEVKPFPDLPAGTYQFNVLAQGGEFEQATQLTAEVTGQPELTISAPDQRLSGQATAGTTTAFDLIVRNTGSAPARNVELSASPPAGWNVTFQPEQIPELANGQQIEVTANVQPAEQAVPGDYMVKFTAQPQDGPSHEADFRVTVLTSALWGIVGVALIAVAVAVVGLAVLRFGRR